MVGNADRDERRVSWRRERMSCEMRVFLLARRYANENLLNNNIPNIYNISSVATVVRVLFNKADAIFAKVWKFIEVNADNLTGIRLCQIK